MRQADVVKPHDDTQQQGMRIVYVGGELDDVHSYLVR